MDKPRFMCGFRGETDWEFKGRKYATRSAACPGDGRTETSADGWYNGDYYFVGILPAVGTIRNDDSKHFHEFPPDEVCALFPDYVPARWLPDFSALEYKGEKPQTITVPWGHVIAVKVAEKHELDKAQYVPVLA
jgi:hypothetical protein